LEAAVGNCTRKTKGRAFGLLVTLVLAACAPRPLPPPPAPTTPLHPEFLFPTLPEGTPEAYANLVEVGWRYLQAHNLRTAERSFQELLKRQPSFPPAETGLGYVELADRDATDAVARFDRALQMLPNYVPALVGRGQALLELNRDGDALASFESALKLDRSLKDLQGRIEVLRFRALQDSLARAKAATDAARWDEARAAYTQAIAASPDSSFLYRDLGMVERKAGQPSAALEHFRKAVALDPNDARSHAQIGAILEEQDDVSGALATYETAAAIDPSEVPEEALARLRELAALAKLPAEYRAITATPNVTRADVAALIGVRLAALIAETRPRQVVITDIRNNWAQQWIMPVVRAGIMDTQPNYTFQPAGRVRRGDLAQTVSRVLGLIAARHPARAKRWQGTAAKIADVSPGHLSYPAVSQAVASGVMPLETGGFHLLRPISGAEAVDVVGRLEALAADERGRR
jgi:tetratricopeptide (TPR) repeat protein